MKAYIAQKDLEALNVDINKMVEETEKELRNKVQQLAMSAYGVIAEQANDKLKSTREQYINSLSVHNIASGEDNDIWVITLKGDARWIEEGQMPRDMLKDLINGKSSKVSKEGHRYNIIPFKHDKPAGNQSLQELRLSSAIKQYMMHHKLDKVIKHKGKPMFGKVASFTVNDPLAPKGKDGQNLLSNVTIYQRPLKAKGGGIRVKRDVMTFRVASEKQMGQGKWRHPGSQGLHAFTEAERRLNEVWTQMIQETVRRMGV